MKAQDPLKTCSVLLISSDVEWNNAYLMAMKKRFVVQEHVCDSVWQADAAIEKKKPDLIVLMYRQDMPKQDVQRILKRRHHPIPVIAVANGGADALLKAGATFASGYSDLFSAVQYSEMIMRDAERAKAQHDAEQQLRVLGQLNQALYRDAPDPMCYVQDGLFMDANTAFMSAFAVSDREVLHDITLLSLVMPRSEKPLKQLLKVVTDKGISSTELLDMETLEGEKKAYTCTASKVSYKGEPAIQMHWRDANAGGGGSSIDPTTGLMGLDVVRQAIKSAQEQRGDEETLGSWVYLWIENYREIWGQDGYPTAEILMKAAADSVARYMPASTIAARFNDDALILFASGTVNATIDRMEVLIHHLHDQVPENIGRMIKPSPFAMIENIGAQTTCEMCLSNSFRAVRSLALSQGQDRVVAGKSGSIPRNDERRLGMLQNMLDENRILVSYQPIIHLEADSKMRFAVHLSVQNDSEQDEDIELDSLIAVAARHNRGKALDELKLNTLLRDILSFDGDQRAITGFVSFGGQSLQEKGFADWVLSQLKQTGVAPGQLVCEVALDTAVNAFSGVQTFAKQVKPSGVRIALTGIGRLDAEVTELLSRLQPDILKLDMREIDTFEDDEEERFMKAVKEYSEEHGQTIIVDNMESPAQLSRVWPYDLQLLQGNGIVPAQNNFDYDFTEPLF